jgi:hypothetical protein
MEILNEINSIRNIMGLPLLNEGKGVSEIITKLIDGAFKNVLKEEEKSLIRTFLTSPKKLVGKLGKDFERFVISTEGQNFIKEIDSEIAKETNPAKKINGQTFLDSIRNFKAEGGEVTKKLIKTTMQDLEKSYPTLFQKKWYGSYVNQGKISSVEKQLIREFKGKSAKDIETLIEAKLSQAESKLSKIKMPQKRKSAYQKIIKNYGEYIKKNPIKGPLVTLGAVPVIGTVVYLLYGFFENWYDTGSPISAVMSSGTDIWGDIKKGWYSAKPYPNTPNGLLSYLTDKYGPNDYQNNFKLNPPVNGVVTITPISGGETKSFQHNGKTFIEL